MHTFRFRGRLHGFTLVEMLVVIAIIGVLAALLLPALAKGKERAQHIRCVANLQQLGLSFHSFAHDHGGKFPAQISTNEEGSMEFASEGYHIGGDLYFSFRHFQTLSNEALTPNILVCLADKRVAAPNFPELRDTNLSYFINVKSEYGKSDQFLAGDRNFTQQGNRYGWSGELHRSRGNMLFADGRVEMLKYVTAAQIDVPSAPPTTTSDAGASANESAPSPLNASHLEKHDKKKPRMTFPLPAAGGPAGLAMAMANSALNAEMTIVPSMVTNSAGTNGPARAAVVVEKETSARQGEVATEVREPVPTKAGSLLWWLLLLLVLALLAYLEWRRQWNARRRRMGG